MNKGKTSRKVLSAIVTTLAAFGAWAETQFAYTVTDGEATITGATDIGESLIIPDTIDGYPVVAIGRKAFNFELDLEYLNIPEGIKDIGEHAFSLCHGMEEVIIPDSVTNIGHYAFYKCYDVERIEIGSGVKTIDNWAFGECYALSELHISHGVETIEEYAFGMCYSLESVTLPSSVKNIKWGAFANIVPLRTVYIHAATENSAGVFENSPNVEVRYYNCQTPAAPQPAWSVEATDDLNGRIRVSWEMDTESEVSSYQIYRAMRPHLKKATLVAEVPAGGELVYEDTDVSSDYTYCYWVRSVNDIFNGAFSEVATGYCEDPREELTFYVDAANGDDGNTGLTRGSAFKTLQKAIDLAGNWDKIIVADGVYAPIATHNRRVVIESESGYKNAIIDGGGESVCAWLGGADVEIDPDEPLPYTLDNWAGNKTILRGFTLRNGSGRCGAGAIGGTLENCLIVSNVVEATTSHSASPDGFGGGAYNSILRNCTITDNSSLPLFSDDDTKWGGLGGGCWNCKLYGCIEWGNTEDPESSESAMWWGGSSNEYDEFCYLDDPIFANAANGDYRLTRNSPAVVEGVVTAGCDTEVVEPKTLYVDAANGNDTADGLSRANAVKTLQTAVDRAVNGDTVLVADGTYAPIHVEDKRITIESENGYKTTIIDGGGTNGCMYAVYSIWDMPSTNAILRGFTLANGYSYRGAGACGGTLERCLIFGNAAINEGPGYGAAYYYGQGGGAYGSVLRYCTIVNNSAEFWPGYEWEDPPQTSGGEGGGAYGCTLENCIVYGNEGVVAPDASNSEYSNDSHIGVDPLFANAANGDYRLMPNSPAVVDGVAMAGCETEVMSGTVPELTPAQAAAWVSEDLAARYAKSGESAADYQNRFEAKFGVDPVAAMAMQTDKKDAQGNDMYVWQDYVAGTDPTDTNSVFTATITMVDGEPVVEWSPKLSAAEESRRRYTIYGKAGLESGEEWHSPTNALDRFFTVGVEMR